MDTLNLMLWGVLPYIAMAVFVVGHTWRYRYDQFGWTSRSSETYENRLLSWGGPLFHYGILLVLAGHIVGLLIPMEWIAALGVPEWLYHLAAVGLGTFAAIITIVGLALLIYRRRTVGPVFLATTTMDKVMYVFLGGTILLGALATVTTQIFGAGYEYRETVSPWVRSILLFHPEPQLMAGVPILFQLHALAATLLFILWPFTRLVHVFSAPVFYLFRPYIVYRTRDQRTGMRPARRGWQPVQAPDPRRLHRP
ncbi:respiratory nitrate reductase subunit gamma [Microbacterium xylanilyticum]